MVCGRYRPLLKYKLGLVVGTLHKVRDATEYYNLYEVYGETYNTAGVLQDTFVLGSEWGYPTGTPTNTRIQSDLSHAMTYEGASTTKFAHDQEQIAVQNVSPAYINAHAYPPQDSNLLLNCSNPHHTLTALYAPFLVTL